MDEKSVFISKPKLRNTEIWTTCYQKMISWETVKGLYRDQRELKFPTKHSQVANFGESSQIGRAHV